MEQASSTIPEMRLKYLSMRDAAKELGVSRPQIYYLKNTGQIKAQNIAGYWVISEKELGRYMESRKAKGEQ